MRSILLILLILVQTAEVGLAMTTGGSCAGLLATISEQASNNTEIYVRLFRALIEDKNVLSNEDLDLLLSEGMPSNPMVFVEGKLPSEQYFAFDQAFKKLLSTANNGAFDWNKIKAAITELQSGKSESVSRRNDAQEDTRNVMLPIFKEKKQYTTGKILTSFDVQGKSLRVFRDNLGGFFLVDVAGNRNNLLKAYTKGMFPDARVFETKYGTWLVVHGGNYEYSVFRIENFDSVQTAISDGHLPDHEYYEIESLSESAPGEPTIVFKIFDAKWDGKDKETLGYLSVNASNGSQKIYDNSTLTHPLAKENFFSHVAITKDAALIKIDVKDNKILMADLPSGLELEKIDHVNDLRNEMSGVKNPRLIVEYHGEYLMGGDYSFESLILATKAGVKSYAIPEVILNPKSKIVKLKSGKSFLVIGSESFMPGGDFHLVVLDLNNWVPSLLTLKDIRGKFSDAFDVNGNLDVSFIDTSTTFRTVYQVFGHLGQGATK